MPCDVRCIYFPTNENIEYKTDKDGVKVGENERLCLFDLTKIESWNMECPRGKPFLLKNKKR